MPQLIEMDRHVSLFEQMEEQHVGSVILINTFTVEPEEADQLQQAWASDAAFMRQQPGFISTQLHRGIGGSSVFVNYAVWESVEQFKGGIHQPRVPGEAAGLPARCCGVATPLQEGRSAWNLRGLITAKGYYMSAKENEELALVLIEARYRGRPPPYTPGAAY